MSESSRELTKDEIVIEFVSEDDLQDSDYIDEYLNNMQPTQKFIYD